MADSGDLPKYLLSSVDAFVGETRQGVVEDGSGEIRCKAEVARGGFISPISRPFLGIERRWFMQTK